MNEKTPEKKMIMVPLGRSPKVSKRYGKDPGYLDYGPDRRVDFEDMADANEILKEVQSILAEFGQEYSDIQVESCRDQYDDYKYLRWVGRRLENDIEFEFRMKKETEDKTSKEKRDREQYEALKKKFGG